MSSRPAQVIDRLPQRRMSNNEPRESMNCKSCRKRKIKCNRMRPTCEACGVFQCPCIYDAVPKKRGPKTDVLEALLKRVDGLEKKLKEEKKSHSPKDDASGTTDETLDDDQSKRFHQEIASIVEESAVYSPGSPSEPSPTIQQDLLLDTYFMRCHGKPFFVLEETSVRYRFQRNQVSSFLLSAIYAVSARFTDHPNGYHAAVRLSEDYTARARAELDIDEPSIDTLQALLLLHVAFTASGQSKKAYMMLASAIGMTVALELHRELDHTIRTTPADKELRRRLFWTCYIMDRFMASGAKRPSLISDKSIELRLPSWSPNSAGLPIDGEYFHNSAAPQGNKSNQGSDGMLIEIVRILGITNRYLAAGGVKGEIYETSAYQNSKLIGGTGESHFPWHALSNLSKIRQDLEIWASSTPDVFFSVESLFGQPDSTTLVLSKLVYHLIHCLIYRPFLPIDLIELAGNGQHQPWQIEATNFCFMHANAIAELVEHGKHSVSIEWPAFVGYCICTAGTVHVHGAHYKGGREGEVFSASADFLTREMQQLSELRYAWASVQHQRDTLQAIYGCHSDLVKSRTSNPIRYSPVFQSDDFFDRYNETGHVFDGAYISFADTVVPSPDTYTGHDIYAPRFNNTLSGYGCSNDGIPTLPSSKRKPSSARKRILASGRRALTSTCDPIPRSSSTDQLPLPPLLRTNFPNGPSSMPNSSHGNYSPSRSYSTLPLAVEETPHDSSYDPMFGIPQMGAGGLQAGGYGYGEHAAPPAGGASKRRTPTPGGEEMDPFLRALEQLAENEHSRPGQHEMDYYLNGAQNGV